MHKRSLTNPLLSILLRTDCSDTINETTQKFYSIYNQTLINKQSINMHLRFKVLHRVFRYIKLMYNYPHDKKEDHFKVIKSLTTSKHI